MNARRHKNYVEVTRLLSSDLFNSLEREVLVDAAEGLLLMRGSDEWDIAEVETTVEATLAGLLAGNRIKPATASNLRKRIRKCGPSGSALTGKTAAVG